MATISIIDYEMGNLFSIKGALEYLGAQYEVISDPGKIEKADKIVLPGVGSFWKAMDIIVKRRIDKALEQAVVVNRKPLLGICLGMQLLASGGREGGECKGLDFIKASVDKIEPIGTGLKIPHVGFNTARFVEGSRMFAGIDPGADYYFIHSYKMTCENKSDIAATTVYGSEFVSAVEKGNIWGCQFHPEKSQKNGLQLLRNFIEY